MIRCDGLDDLLDAAAVLAEQPLARGSGVGIVCNARGPGVVCADACTDAGPERRELSDETQAALRELLPPTSVVAGPVQLVAAESPAGFRAAVEHVAADPAVDAVIAIFVEHIATGADEAAAALAAAAPALHAAGTPLLAVFMTPGPLPHAAARPRCRAARRTRPARRAAASSPRPAAPARASRSRPSARPRPPPARSAAPPPTGASARRRRRAADARRHRRRRRGRRSWPARSPAAAAGCARTRSRRCSAPTGSTLVEQRRVGSVAAAAKAAAELGGPVALKGIAPGVVHKAQAGAVRLGLSGPTAVRRAAHEIAQRLEAAGTPVEDFLVQRMAGAGVEMLVGVLADERFGPVVACGAGGGTAEVLEDVAVRLAPLAHEDAHAMICQLRSLALLERAGADVDALADIAVRVGALAEAHPAIAELDLNPVMVGPEGARVVDARVRVAPPAVQPVFPAVGR